MRGYLGKWKQPKVLIGTALYTEVMKPVSILSLSLQSDDADIVFSIRSILKTIKALQSLSEKEPKEWPTLQLVKSRINDQREYQGIPVTPSFESIVDKCKADSIADLHRLERKIKERLQWSNMQLFLKLRAGSNKKTPVTLKEPVMMNLL